MMIVMKQTATEDEVRAVVERIESVGARAHRSSGEEVTVIGAIGDREHIARLELEGNPGVDRVVPILKPYKLASSQIRHDQPSVLDIAGRKIGGEHFALIAGPCTVESRNQTLETARVVKSVGATMFRGGAYKPRTSPYAFQGLGRAGLRILAEPVERVGRGARLVRAAAVERGAGGLDDLRRRHHLLARLDRARAGDQREVLAPDLAPTDLQHARLAVADL